MLSSIHNRRIRSIAASACGVFALFAAVPAAASAACAAAPASEAFAQFGDSSQYSLAPGGTFESGAGGWTLSNAAIVEGNESYNLAPGTHSLAIEANGLASSPWICIGSEYPTFRFVARQLSGSSRSTLGVSLRWVDLLGLTIESPAGSVPAGGSWTPSPIMKLGNSVALWLPGSAADVQLVFKPAGGGSWGIDDVFVDPYQK